MFAIAAALALVMDQPPATTADDSASLRRIGAALAKPAPALVVKAPLLEPTYRVEIRQHPYFTEVPLVWTFAGGGVPTQKPTGPGQPLITVGVPIGGGGDQGVLPILRAIKRSLDERGAHDEVSRAIAEFCASHGC